MYKSPNQVSQLGDVFWLSVVVDFGNNPDILPFVQGSTIAQKFAVSGITINLHGWHGLWF
ncbi:hypothetical protein ACN23B_06360 [Anabaena sp. FACHB-709]|uniref:Uncharacterized protein n=1 Tax=Trichormus variabilis NIES-23 TaxID=1973479 RepID=A0A1Z4KTI0_ANAVA|nr:MULTISPECIES: hypothetical protein [Nostocaceae]BAY72249.1 hypothetical protein NIES23_50730 [Trichormus variabilis NIES-23]HBW29175.1 hypothetical protein [Nostoc sp. UBA8866]MBD2262429.1 hypothetical protein [Anabaena sp. FACHB-709]MBD2271976.1 hypothetical protein [Nostoc sp. PCC 7120 = FACHB-418]MBD2282766.1 hypothetical protein [Anabaena cylindrica FACHB-170]